MLANLPSIVHAVAWFCMVLVPKVAAIQCFETSDELRTAARSYNDPNVTAIYGPVSDWCTLNIEDFSNVFADQGDFNEDISGWDTAKATDMSEMFFNAFAFNQPVNDWFVSTVKDMSAMFWNAHSFNQPLNDWDVSSVQTMNSMFYNASSFNQPLDQWNVQSLSNTNEMFNNASLFNQNLCNWFPQFQPPSDDSSNNMFIGTSCPIQTNLSGTAHLCQGCSSQAPSIWLNSLIWGIAVVTVTALSWH